MEDAVSGVQAGLKGNFGLVLGIARENNELGLKLNGADIVVKDMREIDIDDVEEWFSKGLGKDAAHRFSPGARSLDMYGRLSIRCHGTALCPVS